MGERLTKEREAETRKYYAGEAQPSYYVPPEPGDYALADVRDLLAEIDALRAAPPTTYLHADGTEEPIGELVARLTRERDEACARLARLSDAAGALIRAAGIGEGEAVIDAALVVELAAARMPAPVVSEEQAQLAELRHLHAALSTPGPTLDSIRRDAQVEVLRDAVDTACDAVLAAVPCCNGTAAVHAVRRSLEKRADDLEAGR